MNYSQKETAPYILLLLWIILPLIAVSSSIYYGLLSSDCGTDWVFLDMLAVYRIAFYALGTLTLVLSAHRIFTCSQHIFCRESVKREPWFYLLSFVLFWSILSTSFSVEWVGSFLGSYTCNDGLLSYFIYASLLVCAMQIRSDEKKEQLMTLFTVVTSILSVLMVLREAEVVWAQKCFRSPRAAVFIQFNHFGYILCISILLLTGLFLYSNRTEKRVYCILSILLQTYALIVNNTFGAYLAIWIALIFIYVIYAFTGRRISAGSLLPAATVLTVSLFSLFNVLPLADAMIFRNFSQLFKDILKIASQAEDAGSAGTTRWKLWLEALKLLPGHLLLGYGPEGLLHTEYELVAGASRPHNEYIQLAAFSGIPALIAYLAGLIALLGRQWKRLKSLGKSTLIAAGAVFGYLVSAFFGVTIFNTYCYLFLLLGFAAVSENDTDILFLHNDYDDDNRNIHLRKLIPVLCALAFITATIFSEAETRFEKERENEDLQAMRCAEATAQLRLKQGTLPDGEYWFDMESFSLIPAHEDRPSAYGSGTAVRGRAVNVFIREFYQSFAYDESKDYRDSVINIIIAQNESTKVKCEWK